MPGIGLTSPTDSHADRSAARDASRPWSVIATAPWPSADAACTRRSTDDRPSKSEYSEWVWRWTNPALLTKAPFRKTCPCQEGSGRSNVLVGHRPTRSIAHRTRSDDRKEMRPRCRRSYRGSRSIPYTTRTRGRGEHTGQGGFPYIPYIWGGQRERAGCESLANDSHPNAL